MFKKRTLILVALLMVSACANQRYTYEDYQYRQPSYEQSIHGTSVLESITIDPQIKTKILNLDAENVSTTDIQETLSQTPAPRVINLHGGIYPVHLSMKSFSEFLIAMGYPEEKIRGPEGGYYSISCYENSYNLAGLMAWYYEKEAMRPMIIGHSQGGTQAVKVLQKLDSDNTRIRPYNPITESREDRYTIINPYSGQAVPVNSVSLSYVSALSSGGLARLLPNQWMMNGRLRSIPDSVDDFTGFYKGMDPLGGDWLGYGRGNRYKSKGSAKVRNIKLPTYYSHGEIPDTISLAQNPEAQAWVNNYRPSGQAFEAFKADKSLPANILWAADVWYSIKKHWVLEAQRLITAQEEL
ncbi:MAG: hypothetical protein V3V61_06195 [Gammaproteobacteria bacterium]